MGRDNLSQCSCSREQLGAWSPSLQLCPQLWHDAVVQSVEVVEVLTAAFAGACDKRGESKMSRATDEQIQEAKAAGALVAWN